MIYKLILLYLFTSFNLNAQNSPQIADYLETELQKFNVPNLDILVVHGDSIMIHESYGQSEESNNLYYIGSASKSFTALGVLKLIWQFNF